MLKKMKIRKSKMHVQVINFSLAISHDEFAQGAVDLAPIFAELPGLISKHWLGNPETGIYGGVYLWESREACEAYINGEVFAAVRDNEHHIDVVSKDFPILEEPTKITRGL